MKIYATIGTSQQTVIADGVKYTPAENEILMQTERPDGACIAQSDGTWAVDKTPQYEALDAEYKAQKSTLCESYATAQMQEDTELAASIAEELTALDAWYDEEHRKIEEA